MTDTPSHSIIGFADENDVRTHGDLEAYYKTLRAAGHRVRLLLIEEIAKVEGEQAEPIPEPAPTNPSTEGGA